MTTNQINKPAPAVAAQRVESRAPAAPSGFVDRQFALLAGVATSIPLRRLAQVFAAVIAAFAVLGGLEFFAPVELAIFDVESEGTVPTAFSGLVLLAAAGAAALVAHSAGLEPRARQAAWFIAAFFVFMGIDDVFSIHERVGTALGVRWQIPMIPVVAVAAFFWLRVLRGLSANRLAYGLWIAGAATWVVSQGFEGLQNAFVPNWEVGTYGKFHAHGLLALIEETAEMAGSSLFLFALLAFLQSRVAGLRGHHPGTE